LKDMKEGTKFATVSFDERQSPANTNLGEMLNPGG